MWYNATVNMLLSRQVLSIYLEKTIKFKDKVINTILSLYCIQLCIYEHVLFDLIEVVGLAIENMVQTSLSEYPDASQFSLINSIFFLSSLHFRRRSVCEGKKQYIRREIWQRFWTRKQGHGQQLNPCAQILLFHFGRHYHHHFSCVQTRPWGRSTNSVGH